MRDDIWAARAPESVAWRDWDELGVIYDGSSGNTHLTSAMGIEILALIVATPRSETELARDLASAMPDDLSPEAVRQSIADQLEQLHNFGLITRSKPAR